MITEDYVSFETAKLLKEKGFDGPCYKVWESHGESSTLVGASCFVEGETVVNRESVDAAAKYYAYEYNLNNKVEGYLAPTLQMVMKWLQETFNIIIIPNYEYECANTPWCYKIFKLGENGEPKPKRVVVKSVSYDKDNNPTKDFVCYRDYEHSYKDYAAKEEAIEEGIKYCLENMI